METVEQINENSDGKKPKKKSLIIGWIVAALAIIVALVLVYFLVLNNPKFILSKNIDKLFAVDLENYESVKIVTEIKASLDLEDKTDEEELTELEKITLKTGFQMDGKEKQEIVDLGLKYDNQSVIDAQLYYDDGEMYAFLEDIFDKYIKLDLDEETKTQFDELFEDFLSEKELKNAEKAIKIMKDELKTQIKENGEFEKEKDTIEIGEDEVKVNKSTVSISEKQLYKIIGNMCSNLVKNDEFLNCFDSESIEEYTGESLKDILKELAEEMKDADGSDKNNIKISLYTKGFLNNNLVAVAVEMYLEDDESTIVAKVVKEDKDVYVYNFAMKADGIKADLVKGKVEIQKDEDSKKEQSGKAIITAEVVELGSAKLEIDYLVEYNQEIDKIDVSNSININNLTQADFEAIGTKLMESPLIGDLIASEMNGFETNIETEDEFLVDPDTEVNIENTLTTSQNEVKDDMYGYSVTYSVPTGFKYEEDYSYDDMKYYELENADYSEIDANVTLRWKTETDYIEDDINWNYDYYLEDTEYYKNVNLSETKTVAVGDKQFKYQILSYESNYGYGSESKYQDAYIWYPLGTEYLFTIELEAADIEISEDIIKGFLNINVTKLN